MIYRPATALRIVKEPRASSLQAMQPILDSFLGGPVALSGCHASGIARPSCEYDVLVVTPEERPATTMRAGGTYFDIFFITDKLMMSPANSEIAVALSSIVHLRDSTLVLSTSSSTAKAMLNENAKRSAEGRLAGALKALGRVDEGLSRGSATDADYWLASAGYDYYFASNFAATALPAPSHALAQMQALSKRGRTNFESWSRATGLERASRSSSERRLEGLSIVYDAIKTSYSEKEGVRTFDRFSSAAAFEVVDAKARFLLSSLQSVDSYAYLGFESVLALSALQQLHSMKSSLEPNYTAIITDLTHGRDRIISEEVVKSMGLTRTERSIRENTDILRESVSDLAKRT